MNIMLILISIAFFICIIILNTIDRWSTRTLFSYQKLWAVNEQFRNKLVERNLQQETQNEMNPFARKFMNKFGVSKGMKIFTVVFVMPLIVIFCLGIMFEIYDPIFTAIYSSFYVGAIYVQVMRALYAKKITKQYGVELK